MPAKIGIVLKTIYSRLFHDAGTLQTSTDSNFPPMSHAPSIIGLEQHLWYLQPGRLDSAVLGALDSSTAHGFHAYITECLV